MKKRIFTALLCAAFVVASSCGSKDTDTPAQPETENTIIADDAQTDEADPDDTLPETEAPEVAPDEAAQDRTDYFALIPDEDYGGREFIIAATDADFADAQSAGGIIGDALGERIDAIEQKYNISIKVVPTEKDAVKGRLAVSGEENYFCDLLYIPMETASVCAEDGFLMNIYSVPFFDESAEYASHEHTGISVQNNTAYGLYGNAAFDDRYTWCIYYNKYFMNGLGYDPAALAASGEWTWEKFMEIAAAAVYDIDKNGKMNAETDRFGYASSAPAADFARAVFASFGKQYFATDDEGFFAMDFAISEQDDYISEIKTICTENDAVYRGKEAFKAFTEGRLAFLCDKLYVAKDLAYLPMEWGVVPMPKRNLQQSGYVTPTDRAVCGYSVPASVADSVLSGKVLNAIYAYDCSYGENYLQKAWTYYYLPDNNSAVNVKNICSGNVYDKADAWCADDTINAASAGIIATAVEKNTDFSKLYDAAAKGFSEYIRSKFMH